MKLVDILKEQGMFRKDINVRIKNKQIKLNGLVVPMEDLDIDLPVVSVEDAGDWVFNNIVPNHEWALQTTIFGLDTLFDVDFTIQNDLTEFIKDFMLLRISKKESLILKIALF